MFCQKVKKDTVVRRNSYKMKREGEQKLKQAVLVSSAEALFSMCGLLYKEEESRVAVIVIEDHSSQRFRLWYCLLDHQDVVCRRALLIIAAVLTATSACPAVLMQMLMISSSSLTKQEKRVRSALVSARTLLGNRIPPPQQKMTGQC